MPALQPAGWSVPEDRSALVAQLRDRISGMQGGPARTPVPTHRALDGLLQLRAGGAYAVDSATLALLLAAGASAAGEWVAVVGWPGFGAQAAVDLGVDLARTVLVPEPGDSWLEVAAALVDVVTVVVLHPAAPVDAAAAGVLEARLRKRSAVLVVWGAWPRVEATVSMEGRWTGPEAGRGVLRTREAVLAVRRGAAPPVRGGWRYPA